MKQIVLLAVAAFAVGMIGRAEGKLIFCYFESWAVYHQGKGHFDVEDIDPNLCTHLIYTFAGVDPTTHKIKALDPWNDLDEGGGKGAYKRFTNLKQQNPSLKTLLSVGGWNEATKGFTAMVSTAENRKIFVDSVLEFMQTYGFDGIDLDWEYPCQREGGKPEDKANYALLMKDLHEGFAGNYVLTTAVPAGIQNVDMSYDIPSLQMYNDYLLLMAFDYHGPWEPFAGHVAPLYGSSKDVAHGDVGHVLNVNYSVSYYINGGPIPGGSGVDPAKLVVGVPLYGKGFNLSDPTQHDLYAPVTGAMGACPYTQSPISCGYNELCEYFFGMSGWNVGHETEQKIVYGYTDHIWVGYDDVDAMNLKAGYIKDNGLAGAMVWSIDQDDHHAVCGSQKFPLLSALSQQLKDA